MAKKHDETNGEIVETATQQPQPSATIGDGITAATTTNNLALIHKQQQLQHEQQLQQGNYSGSHFGVPAFNSDHVIPMTNGCYYDASRTSAGSTKITATLVRHSMRSMNDCCDTTTGFSNSNGEFSDAPKSSAPTSGRLLLSNSNNDFGLTPSVASHKNYCTTTATATAPTSMATGCSTTSAPVAKSNNKFLRVKSNSLTAFNANKSNVVPRSVSHNHDQCGTTIQNAIQIIAMGASARRDNNDDGDDDDNDGANGGSACNNDDYYDGWNERAKFVEQLYGGDSAKVQAAAIVIQKAFRKYQICKRFRMITEQLRHACQSSPVRQPLVNSFSENNKSDNNYESQVCQVAIDNAPPPRYQQAMQIPYASGATRAATWESLSQAASRLAESAAAATAANKVKQSILNGDDAKSANSYQQQQQASGTIAMKQSPTSNNTLSSFIDNNVDRSHNRSRTDPVFTAAAINFQQLESIRKRQYRVGLNIFNKSPEKGVSFLIAHSFIDCSPVYMKSSTSYYLSNQLHFIDKQHLAANQQSTQLMANGKSKSDFVDSKMNITSINKQQQQQDCRLCYEEENLKRNVAHFLLHRKGLAREMIGQYLGNLQSQFIQDVLVYYLQELDFSGMQIDLALRKFSTTLRMPGEAQKIERFVDRFACRYVQCQQGTQASQDYIGSVSGNHSPEVHHLNENEKVKCYGNNLDNQMIVCNLEKNNLTMLTKDEIFILTFAIIMLNTDLHSPSLKSTSRMSANQFVNNLRGVFKSQTITENDLIEIYERVKANQITTTPDHVTHVMKVQQGLTTNNFQKKELPNLCVPHRRLVCFCRLFEVYDISKKERLGQHQREIFLFNDILLITKLARRARANTPQQYTFRQSIHLQGLYVQLFQSAHYSYGIKLCQRSNDQTLIMFNARNELDRSRFVDDLNESMAEMDEMELIKTHNVVETIHFKQLERLRRHAMMHDEPGLIANNKLKSSATTIMNEEQIVFRNESESDRDTTESSNVTVIAKGSRRLPPTKFNSMSNLASVAEITDEIESNQPRMSQMIDLPPSDRSFGQHPACYVVQRGVRSTNQIGVHRSCSTNSVHSLDSGLFLSRDVSPNQSG